METVKDLNSTEENCERVSNPCHESLKKGFSKLQSVLSEMGYNSLKTGQDEAVMNLMFKRDTICVMPTGFGKTAIYVVPARAVNMSTLIFSPLVSLMKDQVEGLWAKGYSAGQVSSGQSVAENNKVLTDWESGELQFLLIAPERLQSDKFISTMKARPPEFVVVDEAHCVSQWAHSFRPDYVRIGDFIDTFKPDVVLALTATMTEEMEGDVRDTLSIKNASKIVYYPVRDNLKFENYTYDLTTIRHLLNKISGSTIVYASTKKATHELYDTLKGSIGGGCLVYNGGLTPDERTTNQNMFMSGEVRVMFATNAFGMGIDKGDIRAVIHIDLPGSIEQYAQEVGRAGRDGEMSRCIFMENAKSINTQLWFLDTTYPDSSVITRVYQRLKQLSSKDGVARITNADLSTQLGIDPAFIASAKGILISNNIITSTKSKDKTAKLKLLDESDVIKSDKIVANVLKYGYTVGSHIEFDLDFTAEQCVCAVSTLKTKLSKLSKAGSIIYIAPFRGNEVKLINDISELDFDLCDKKRKQAKDKMLDLIRFLKLSSDKKHSFLVEYFK